MVVQLHFLRDIHSLPFSLCLSWRARQYWLLKCTGSVLPHLSDESFHNTLSMCVYFQGSFKIIHVPLGRSGPQRCQTLRKQCCVYCNTTCWNNSEIIQMHSYHTKYVFIPVNQRFSPEKNNYQYSIIHWSIFSVYGVLWIMDSWVHMHMQAVQFDGANRGWRGQKCVSSTKRM